MQQANFLEAENYFLVPFLGMIAPLSSSHGNFLCVKACLVVL